MIAPVAPADEGDPPDLQVVEQPDHVVRHQIVAERLRTAGRAAVPPAIHDDDAIMRGDERTHLIAPIIRIAETAMHEQHRLALSELRIPDTNSVYRRGAAGVGFRQCGASAAGSSIAVARPSPPSPAASRLRKSIPRMMPPNGSCHRRSVSRRRRSMSRRCLSG